MLIENLEREYMVQVAKFIDEREFGDINSYDYLNSEPIIEIGLQNIRHTHSYFYEDDHRSK